MHNFDIVIIGGGVSGTAIARELSKYKLRIALLEKEEELAFGVSKSNSGIIHPGTQNPPDSLKGKLCVRGNKLLRKTAKYLGVDFKQVGELIVAFSDEELKQLQDIKSKAAKLGVRDLRLVDRKWLSKHEPNLSVDIIAALYAPSAGVVSPYRLVYDMAENAQANGVVIYTGCKVTAIQQVQKNNRRFVIETAIGSFESDHVINCAGLYADVISSMVGVDDFVIHPRKGQEVLLDKKKENITKHLIFPVPSKTSKGVLVIKTSDGNPMIGPTAEDVSDKEDRETTAQGLQTVLDCVRKMVPSIEERDIIAYFAGLRPVAGADFIIRHENSVPGFINVAGIQSPGLTSAPAIAEMVAGLLKDNGLRMKKKLFFKKFRRKPVHIFSSSLEKAGKLIKNDPSYGDIVCRCEMVSSKEIREAIKRGAVTMDGIKFRTRAQSGRCHGGFCTTRIMKIMAEERWMNLTQITKRGKGSEIVKEDRAS